MNGRRVAVAVVILAAAVAAGLLAADVNSWRTAVARGDARFAQSPANASWHADTVLPFHVARTILGLSDQLALRSAAKQFVHLRSVGNGVDNGYSESLQRGALEGVLTQLAAGPDRVRDSEAECALAVERGANPGCSVTRA